MHKTRMETPQSSDVELAEMLKRSRRLDEKALGSLHDYYFPKIYSYAIYRLGKRKASLEASAEVVIRLLEAIRSRIAVRHLSGWLFTKTAEHIELRQLEARKSRQVSPGEIVEEEAGMGKYGTFFRQSLQKIPPEQQHFIALRFSQPFSLEELAGWLGMREIEIRRLQYQSLSALLRALGGKATGSGEDEGRERALQVCLVNMAENSQLEEIAAAYPKWSEELYALLEVAHFAGFPGGIAPGETGNPEAAMKEIETAQQQSKTEFLLVAQNPVKKTRSPMLRRWVFAGIGVVVLLAACLGTIAILSSQAKAGDVFYGMRRNLESLLVAVKQSATARLELELKYDQESLHKGEEQLGAGQTGPVSFSGMLDNMEGEQWEVGGLRVYVPPEAQIVGSLYPGYMVTVEGEITSEGIIEARRVQMRVYQIRDEAESASAGSLLLGDLEVAITSDTILHGKLETGRRVTAYLWMPSNLVPQARLIEVDK